MAPPLIGYMTLNKLSNPPKPRFPDLQNGNEKNVYLIESLRGVKGAMQVRLGAAAGITGILHFERLTFQAVDLPCICFTSFFIKLGGRRQSFTALGFSPKGTEGKTQIC